MRDAIIIAAAIVGYAIFRLIMCRCKAEVVRVGDSHAMTYHDAEQLHSLAKHTPEALPEASDRVRHLCRNWQAILDALQGCDVARHNGRLVLTLDEGVTLLDLYEIDVL